MNFLYKIRNFQAVLEKSVELAKEFEQYKEDAANNIKALEDKAWDLLEENSKLKDSKLKSDGANEKLKEELNSSKMETAAVKDELAKANRTIGGYKKSNNDYKKKNEELEKQVSELTKQVNDLKSDRYLIRKVPTGKTKNTIKTSIRNYANESRVIKYVKDNL